MLNSKKVQILSITSSYLDVIYRTVHYRKMINIRQAKPDEISIGTDEHK
jgi:hypothetical protein